MTRIHLDTDLGGDIDDLCALALLLRWPAAEITGVTTVAEDGGRRAGYARYALALAGRADIPVAAGADAAYGPYRHPIPALFPREDRYWPAPVPRAPTPVADALALLKRSVEGGARIVATGPYTNLALLDTAYPGLLRRAALYLMGGHVHPIRLPRLGGQHGRQHPVRCRVRAPCPRRVVPDPHPHRGDGADGTASCSYSCTAGFRPPRGALGAAGRRAR